MNNISLMLENFAQFIGPIRTARGAPCEICRNPSVWVLVRRRHLNGTVGNYTEFDPEAKEHARCADHLGDAWVIDGLDRSEAP